MPEYPNETFPATVEASSQSVDVGSGTTRMQLALDNAKGELAAAKSRPSSEDPAWTNTGRP